MSLEIDPHESTAHSIARLEALARLMDGALVIAGTRICFGLDSLIGVVPVAGDAIGGRISSYLIWAARRLEVPRWPLARMVAHTLIDTTLGSIPLLGDAFDVLYRPNMRNMALLRGHLQRTGTMRASGPVIEGEAVRVE